MDQDGDHIKMSFEYFRIQKLKTQGFRSEKVDEKRGHLSSFHVLFLSYGPSIV